MGVGSGVGVAVGVGVGVGSGAGVGDGAGVAVGGGVLGASVVVGAPVAWMTAVGVAAGAVPDSPQAKPAVMTNVKTPTAAVRLNVRPKILKAFPSVPPSRRCC